MTEKQRMFAISQYLGAKPKYVKGLYSKKNSYWKCGNCASILKHDIVENYCFNCGYRVLWDSPRCLTGSSQLKIKKGLSQMQLSDFIKEGLC